MGELARERPRHPIEALAFSYKDATKVKAQIERFGLATVVGEIKPQGCIMAGQAPEPPWVRARREKHAAHKAVRREGATEATED